MQTRVCAHSGGMLHRVFLESDQYSENIFALGKVGMAAREGRVIYALKDRLCHVNIVNPFEFI